MWPHVCQCTSRLVLIAAEAHEPPEGWQGASNYVQRHLTLNGSDTFLIWTFPQVGNLPLWSLHVRVKRAHASASFSARMRDANSSIVNYYMRSKDQRWSLSEEIAKAKGSERGKLSHNIAPLNSQGYSRRISEKAELRQRRTFRKWQFLYTSIRSSTGIYL